jgi:hypothetical protein
MYTVIYIRETLSSVLVLCTSANISKLKILLSFYWSHKYEMKKIKNCADKNHNKILQNILIEFLTPFLK